MMRPRANEERAAPAGDVVHRFRFTVSDEAIDRNGHVNNVVFVQWMQDVAIRHFESTGCADAMDAAGGTWVARSHHIEYLSPAFLGDLVEARTWVADFHRVCSLRRYEFVRVSDGKALAKGETEWAFVSVETGRPLAIPAEILRAFRSASDGAP